jgi:hypothetical protein
MKVDNFSLSKPEKVAYKDGLKSLKKFRELNGFMQNMSMFLWEWRTLYLETTREIAVPSFWNRRMVDADLCFIEFF